MIAGNQRRGLTMIEMLVCLFIIGLAAAILIPAVQTAREAGRRLECESRLGQLGRALQSFESARAAFPSALASRPPPQSLSSDLFYAPHVHLLPFVEQVPLYGRFNLATQQFFVPDPSTLSDAAKTKIATYLCPSDWGDSGTNYRACLGPGPYCLWQSTLAPGGGLGAFSVLYAFKPGDFTDGLANTIGVSEKLKSPNPQGGYTPETFWYSGVSNLGLPLPGTDVAVSTCGSLIGPPPNFFPDAGGTWYIAAYEYTWYNHTVTPNAATSDCSMESPGAPGTSGGVFKASSHHPGGVNCAFMDGHVKFIADSVDLEIWRALATRAGGEALADATF